MFYFLCIWPTELSPILWPVIELGGELKFFIFLRDHPCIIVNVASKWGLTSVNYTELVQLHEKYEANGLRILAFPCNQFGGQVFVHEFCVNAIIL